MQTREQYEEAKLFEKIFPGLQRGYGLWSNSNGYDFKHKPITLQHYIDHLEGRISLGVVPIGDDDFCKFGALDDDTHKKDKKNIQKWSKEKYQKLLDKIKFLKLPLTVCKSKGGGAHMFLLLDKFYKAKDVRHILKKFAYALGYERDDIEIFPKQDTLTNKDGTRGDGSFINLPYHNGNTRVLLDFSGNELNASDGIKYASKRITNEDNWKKFKLLDHGKPQHRNDRTFAATAFFKKHYDDWEQKVKDYNQLFNDPPLGEAPKDSPNRLENTVLKSNERKDYFDQEEEAPPTELVGHDISAYRLLGITQPKFVTERLFKERSINFTFGEKGKGKTEFCLGMANAMVRGLPFLHYKHPVANPVLYIDGEMDPFDVIERDTPYLENFGKPPKDYLHIINWHFQMFQKIPDIKEKVGQDLILQYLRKQEGLTGKKPFLFLDNLRSLSNYIENDSDSWRPIGLWLRDLRGHGYSSNVVDHTGKSKEFGMRGTSSKSDWANVCMQVIPEAEKGSRYMKMTIHFDKARGLKPNETEDYIAQYDFAGNWTLGQSIKDQEDQEHKNQITEMLKADKKPSQRKIADELGISLGKVNKFIKEIKKK